MPEAFASALSTDGLIWLLLAIVVAGLVRGFSGFGSALIIMPVASSVLSPYGALAFLTIVEVFGPLPNLRSALREGGRDDVLRLILGVVVALPLGLLALSWMSPDIFGWMVSVIVLVVLVLLMMGWRYKGQLSTSTIVGIGGLGGFLGGISGLAGPPVIMFYMASVHPISVIRANFLLYLMSVDIVMIGVFWAFDLYDFDAVVIGLMMILPYMLANIAGARLFNPAAEGNFRAIAYGIIAMSALLGLPLWE